MKQTCRFRCSFLTNSFPHPSAVHRNWRFPEPAEPPPRPREVPLRFAVSDSPEFDAASPPLRVDTDGTLRPRELFGALLLGSGIVGPTRRRFGDGASFSSSRNA